MTQQSRLVSRQSTTQTTSQQRKRRPKSKQLWLPKADDGYSRKSTIHITPPCDPEYLEKAGDELKGVLENIYAKLVDEFTATVELIAYPRPVPLDDVDMEAILCFAFHISPYYIDNRRTQKQLTDYDERMLAKTSEPAYDIVKEPLPDNFNVEVGTLCLDPIAVGGGVSTCRLLTKDKNALTPAGKVEDDGLLTILEHLTGANEPFVYHALTEPGKSKDCATVRLVTFTPEHNHTGKRGLARLDSQGHPGDLARTFEKISVTSNYNIDTEAYFDIDYTHRIDGTESYTVTYDDSMRKRYLTRSQFRSEADEVLELVLGHPEFYNLLVGSTNRDKLYDDLGYHARFWINETSLSHFAKLYLHAYDINPWVYAPARSAPEFEPHEGDNTEAQTDWTQPTAELETTTRHQTDGSNAHIKFGKRFAHAARASGDQISRVDQDGSSQSDYGLSPENGRIHIVEKQVDSDIVAVEPEWRNSTKFSNVLINVERAIANDQHVITVFPNEPLAKRAYENLLVPFKKVTERGAHLFTLSDSVPKIDGTRLVMPAGEHSLWYLTPDGELVLYVDGKEVARCDAEADLTTVEYDCATATRVDGNMVVTTPTGETITYKTDEAYKREWSQVALPHVPIDISYLEYVTIMYETGGKNEQTGTFREYEPYPDWVDASKPSQRYNKFGEHITGTFVIEADGSELSLKECHNRMMHIYERCTAKKQPKLNWFGRGLPDYIDRKDGEGGKKILVDHTWVFPRGLVSPHLPGVDPDAELDRLK